jgi:hypothetical protein
MQFHEEFCILSLYFTIYIASSQPFLTANFKFNLIFGIFIKPYELFIERNLKYSLSTFQNRYFSYHPY